MGNSVANALPALTPEQRQAAAGQFERANQVVSTGNHDYGIRLLLSCCKLDPGNLIYRQALRRTQKARFRDNLRGSRWAWLLNFPNRLRVKSALRSGEYANVLETGELILIRNPWHVRTQMDMAEAASELGLQDMAIWMLEQARQKKPHHVTLNSALADLYEKRGNYTQAAALWKLIQKDRPHDPEPVHKLKNLAANETIARGKYDHRVSQPEEPPQPPTDELPADTSATIDVSDVNARLGPQARDATRLERQLEKEPGNARLYLQLAQLYRHATEFEVAAEILQRGLGPTGQSFDLQMELADLEIEQFRRNLAVAEAMLEAKPRDEQLLRQRTRLRKEINTRELDIHRRKADRFPTDLRHRLEVGMRLLIAGRLEEAIGELQAARADMRCRWQALLQLGHCFKARNNWRLAQRNYQEALNDLPGTEEVARKEILYSLASGAADSGDITQAIDLGNELANLDFGYRDIARLLDEWQATVEEENRSAG